MQMSCLPGKQTGIAVCFPDKQDLYMFATPFIPENTLHLYVIST